MDPVRFLSNHSTGKMGYAIAARAAWCAGEARSFPDRPRSTRRTGVNARGHPFGAGYVRRGDEPRREQDFYHQGCRRR